MAKTIDAKFLEGLTYSTTEKKKTKGKDGKEKVTRVVVERPLTVDDLLDWKDKGAEVVIATKDGRKHTIAKKKTA